MKTQNKDKKGSDKKCKSNPEVQETAFEKRLRERLEGGEFRLLNEKMYNNEELTAEQIERYHEYYRNRIKEWPADPNAMVLKELSEIFAKKEASAELKVADLGCGDSDKYKKCKLNGRRVDFSFFDKYPVNENVIRADLHKIPVENKEFDVVVCCLSLMMEDVTKVMKEVNRILKVGGMFLFAEVRSRLDSIHRFVTRMEKFGYKSENVNSSNKYFTIIKLKKTEDTHDSKKLSLKMKKCTYKKNKQIK